MVKRLELVEEATTKGLMLPAEPCRLKVTVEEVAFMPTTVPLSMSLPSPRVEPEVQMALKPVVPPLKAFCLLLKVLQSAAVKEPVAVAAALGIEIVKTLLAILAVNRLPVVLVATEVGTLVLTAMVEVPEIEMPVPELSKVLISTKAGLAPVPWAARTL